MLLDPGAFPDFYREIWRDRRQEPFEWQTDLVRQVATTGEWPHLVDLPTGAGKTSLIDIALFLLAVDAANPPTERRMPRRIVMVVDRRVVVDQATERAQHLARVLQASGHSVVRGVADGLRSLWDGPEEEPPLLASVLRGGIVRDETWAQRPDAPAVIASTVDQVGSRLLFRGYGISPRMRPVHAGLLGADTLFLLDEVHLSRPFAETLRQLGRYRTQAEREVDNPWQVVEMSATPGRMVDNRFPQEPLDPESSPVLRRRLLASKPAALRLSKGRGDPRNVLARDCADGAVELLRQDHVRALAVVVNRVDTARQVAGLLTERGAAGQVVLLTGRMRPLDRDAVLTEKLRTRLQTGRGRSGDEARLVVVATQCIEAGADFDFDGLVTECASLDALRQRFGRVDRDGWLSESNTPAHSLVLAAAPDVASDADDPVYGEALAATWRALDALDSVDFGVVPFNRLGLSESESLLAPKAVAPHLFPAQFDAWVQTRPGPHPDPDPALWLHGLERPGIVEVEVVWRADLTEDFLRRDQDDAVNLVKSCPPGSGEAMPLPLPAVQAWLVDGGADSRVPVADVEGAVAEEEAWSDAGMRLALRWRQDEAEVLRRPADIRPGDVLVVPASYGGISFENWDPASSAPVPDLGHRVQAEQRRQAVLRLLPPLWPASLTLPRPEEVTEDQRDKEVVEQWLRDHVGDLGRLRTAAQHCLDEWRSTTVLRVTGPRSRWIESGDGEESGTWEPVDGTARYFVVSCARPLPARRLDDAGASGYDPGGDEDSSFLARKVTLTDHLKGVERWARDLASRCGLPEKLAEDVALAARLHDLGKADPRFQVIMYGGDEIAATGEEPRAKSEIPWSDRRRRSAVSRRSGYPKGARHELMSLALIDGSAQLEAAANDWDLVRHLVASHHGWCRPLPPAVEDRHPVHVEVTLDGLTLSGASAHGLERLDSGVPERFWRLVRRYGWHGLAWLEAIMQLADHRCSAEEQEQEQPAEKPTTAGVGS